jgi:flagellar basal-body rod protein FlgC
MNTLNGSIRLSASGLSAERLRLDIISSNIANANSMKVGAQDPYRRREVVLGEGPDGVEVIGVIEDPKPFREVSDPGNPYADANGKVYYSNVEPIYEMVNMMSASRAYEANIAAFNSTKSMIRSALQIGKI